MQVSEEHLAVRTYERGVEDETYSCGTGVTAAALVAHTQFGKPKDLEIQVKGGVLSVKFEEENQKFTEIYLQGAAKKVFQGEIEV